MEEVTVSSNKLGMGLEEGCFEGDTDIQHWPNDSYSTWISLYWRL